jgi:hypothetical protein
MKRFVARTDRIFGVLRRRLAHYTLHSFDRAFCARLWANSADRAIDEVIHCRE